MLRLDTLYSNSYDLHRLVVTMTLMAALVSALGVSAALAAQIQQDGLQPLFERADYLGDYINSPLAFVFNIAQLAAGFCMLLAMFALYLLRFDTYSNYLAVVGSWVGLTIILMGIFPINYLEEHRLVSTGFLIGTFVLHALCLMARFNRQSLCPNPMFILSTLGIISASGLIIQLDWSTLDFASCDHSPHSLCWVAINMWMQVNVVVLWCVTLALTVSHIARSRQKESIYQLKQSDR